MSDGPNFSVRIMTDAELPNLQKKWEHQRKSTPSLGRGNDPLKATTLDEWDAALGNQSWTHISCDACGEYVRQAVRFTRYGDDISLCDNCACIVGALGKAIRK